MADTGTFELKPEHLTLLEYANWDWSNDYGGAPCVDAKRPFGNSGRAALLQDMAELLGVERGGAEDEDGFPSYTAVQEEVLLGLFQETLTALLVVFSARSCEPGTYVNRGGRWMPAGGTA